MAQRNQKSPENSIKSRWLWVGLILVAALSLRIILAITMPWRQDEIVYVDWLGQWFADHLWAYITQWQHTFYPPQSPVFANPPLGMWLISLGIVIGRFFDLSMLVAARCVTIIFGIASLLSLYLLCLRFFTQKIALTSLAIAAFIPLLAANNASAFLDTILGFLLLLTVWQFFVILTIRTVSYKQLAVLALLIGLCMLTKFSILFILAAIGMTITVKLLLSREYAKTIFFIGAAVIIPPLIWSGLRDVHHIQGVISYFNSKYTIMYPWPGQEANYLLYLVHDIPTVVLVLSLAAAFYTKRQKEAGLIIWLLLFSILALLNVRIFAPTSYSYQLVPVLPFIIISAVWALEQSSTIVKRIGLLLIGLELIYLNGAQPISFYSFSQTFISRVVGINRLVPSGTGSEDLPKLGAYIQSQLPSDARVAAIYNDWTLRKYILPTQSTTSLFLDETLKTATSRGANYVVASTYFVSQSSPIAQELKRLTPLEEIKLGRDTLARVYSIPRQTKPIASVPLLETWQPTTENATVTKLATSPTSLSVDVEFNYATSSPTRYASLTSPTLLTLPQQANGIALTIYGEGRSKNIYVDLIDPQSGNYKRATIPLNWNGRHAVEIPFALLTDVRINTAAQSASLKKPLQLRISVDSADSHQISFIVSDLELVEYENSLH